MVARDPRQGQRHGTRRNRISAQPRPVLNGNQHQRGKYPGFQQSQSSRLPERLLRFRRECREQHKNEDGYQVFQHQPADSDSTVWGIEQPLIHQIADHDHGTGNGEGQSK